MWGRGKKAERRTPEPPNALKDAVREARIEAAERSAVVVDLRDAELARLELLNEALDPLFKDIPADVELFDRGVSKGDVPRLWVDVIAHVEMGRDKRQYRFVQDTRYGRAVLAESYEVARDGARGHPLRGAPADRARARACRRRAVRPGHRAEDGGARAAPRPAARDPHFRLRRDRSASSRCSCWRCSSANPYPLAVRKLQLTRFCSSTAPLASMPREINLATPSAGRAVDGVEIIGGGVLAHAGRGRGRRYADRRHARAVRAGRAS